MNLDELTTPALVLDLGVLKRNLAMMQRAIARHPGVVLRPHLKTAKSRDVAMLAAPDFGPVTELSLRDPITLEPLARPQPLAPAQNN